MNDDEKKNNGIQEGWNSWKIYVIKTLDKLDKRQTDLEKDHKEGELSSAKDITEIKTKMKMSSAVISIVVALVIGIIINVFSAYLIGKWMENKYDTNANKEVQDLLNKNTTDGK